jgi:hypothetical protein
MGDYAMGAPVALEAEISERADAFGGAGGNRGLLAQSEAPPADPKPEPEPSPTADKPVSKRLIIYTANFSILVSSAKAAADRLLAAVQAVDGYLQSQSGNRIVVRVPAAKFEPLTKELEDYGAITNRDVRAQDVTAAYRDLAIRIENAEHARDRLLKLLDQAAKTKDLLEIERELRRLTEEIERMKGQLRLMGDQIAFSTLTVSFQEDAPAPRPVTLRRASRFKWINKIGVEHALEQF